MSQTQPRRRRRGLRVILIVLALIVLIPLGGFAVFALTFDPDGVKPRIEQAVKRATGRDLALNGRLGLKLSLWPTIEARDVAFANVAGGSRPQMATLERLEAQIALLPLLRRTVEIDRLVLVKPDILLETDAQGRPNWRFGPEVPSQTLPKTQSPSAPAAPLAIGVRQMTVDGGTLTWRDGRTGRSTRIDLADAAIRADSADSPVDVALHASYAGAPFALTGETGSLARLRDPAATTPWPVRLALEAANAKLGLDGALSQPMQGRGYHAKLDGVVPDLAALAPFFRRAILPPLHDVRVAAEIADAGEGVPGVNGLALRAGASDLGAFVPGLTLNSLQADAAQAGEPVRFVASGALRQAAFTVSGSLAREGAGGATIRDFKLAMPPGDVTGEIATGWAGRLTLRATLASQRIDADALMAALRPPPAAPAQAPQPAPSPSPAPRPASRDTRVFSDRLIPFAVLRAADADLRLAVAILHSGGQDYHDLAGHLVLADGHLSVDPIGGRLPAGRLDGRITVDATQPNPPVGVMLRGPGLQFAPLLTLLGLPADARGAVDIDADLRGAGNTPHALAASADGHLGIAMVNGEIDNRLVSGTLGQVLQHARLPDVTAHPGSLPVRCLAVRLDAHGGVADLRALLLDTSLFYLEGGGSLNLGDETLALRLRPLARLGGTGVIVPLRVGGGFRAPKVEVDATGAAGEAAGIAAEAARSPQFGIIIGALGGNRMVPGGGADDCARQLVLARGGLPGPAPAPAPAPAPSAEKKASKPADLLRQFLR